MAKLEPHDQESCDHRYVTWIWMIGIIISLMGTGVALAWTGSKVMANTESVIELHEKRITNVEIQSSKIDTVIAILRSKP